LGSFGSLGSFGPFGSLGDFPAFAAVGLGVTGGEVMGDEDLPDLCDLADFCSVGLCVGLFVGAVAVVGDRVVGGTVGRGVTGD
jgi:hypothetical protein